MAGDGPEDMEEVSVGCGCDDHNRAVRWAQISESGNEESDDSVKHSRKRGKENVC